MPCGAWAFVFAAIARSLVTSTLFLSVAPRAEWLVKTRLRVADVLDLFKYGLPIMVSVVTDNATRKWDSLVVSKLFGPDVMGSYTTPTTSPRPRSTTSPSTSARS